VGKRESKTYHSEKNGKKDWNEAADDHPACKRDWQGFLAQAWALKQGREILM